MPPINAAMQGLAQAENTFERTAERIARSGPGLLGEDSVSLSDLAVSLLTAKNAYEMNLRSIKTADEMSKKMLDILA